MNSVVAILFFLCIIKVLSDNQVCFGQSMYGGGNEAIVAITDVDQTYDQHMCQSIMKLDCANHHHQNHEDPILQEHICGSDDITYANHCDFAQARCFFVLDHDNYDHHHNQLIDLTVKYHGQCSSTTQAPVQTAKPTLAQTTIAQSTPIVGVATTAGPSGATDVYHTAAPTMNPTHAPGASHPTAAHSTPSVTDSPTSQPSTVSPVDPTPAPTQNPVTTAAPEPTTTTQPAPTTMSMHDIMAEVFCKNLGYISCSAGFTIVCGSDGQFYPNRCELSKAACKNPSLRLVESEQCAV